MVTLSIKDKRITSKYSPEIFTEKMNRFFKDEFSVSDEFILYEMDSDMTPPDVQKAFVDTKKMNDNEFIDYKG